MKSEELFEIDRQIGQIKKVFEQRQEQISDLNLPLKRVLAVLPPHSAHPHS